MDPDQWLRLWLAIGQSVGGGAVTLFGGYVGYRLAGRTERNKARSEALRDLNRSLRELSRVAEELPTDLTGDDTMGRILDRLREILDEDPPPKATPANVVGVELLPKLFKLSLDEARAQRDGEEGRPSPVPAALKEIRNSRAECARWVMHGAPNRTILIRRNKSAKLAVERILEEHRPEGQASTTRS